MPLEVGMTVRLSKVHAPASLREAVKGINAGENSATDQPSTPMKTMCFGFGRAAPVRHRAAIRAASKNFFIR